MKTEYFSTYFDPTINVDSDKMKIKKERSISLPDLVQCSLSVSFLEFTYLQKINLQISLNNNCFLCSNCCLKL